MIFLLEVVVNIKFFTWFSLTRLLVTVTDQNMVAHWELMIEYSEKFHSFLWLYVKKVQQNHIYPKEHWTKNPCNQIKQPLIQF